VTSSGVVGAHFGADKATKCCSTNEIELQEIVVDSSRGKQELPLGEDTVKRSRRKQCADCCRQFIAFLFSTVGSCCLLVGYVVLGGLIFQGLESDHERQTKTDMRMMRMDHVRSVILEECVSRMDGMDHVLDLWNLTEAMNVLHPDDWKREASRVLDSYTLKVSVSPSQSSFMQLGNQQHNIVAIYTVI